ncbi:MAG: GGDEF domain-containing protein [Aliarcobacter sp.]|nr:GGDEF domain-containing protein [Aliarcobacter sp.]
MKKMTLERLLYKNYLKTTLISMFLIELFLVFFYFIVHKNMINKSASFLLKDVEHSISLIVENHSQTINEKMLQIESFDYILNHFSGMKLPYLGKTLIIDKFGEVIFIDENIKKLLEIKLNKSNILNHQNTKIVNYFKEIMQEKNHNKIIIKEEGYLLFSVKIPKNSIYVVIFVKEENILKEIENLESYYEKLAYLVIGSVFIFYIIFFFFLSFKAKCFVDKINEPLLKIIELTKNLGIRRDIKNLEPCGIFEIDRLSSNFNNMTIELEKRTNKLVEEELKRNYQEKLANTDPLTGAYNRRYLNSFSYDYLKIVKRENKELSLLLLDLDDFKKINDTFGHEIGDVVIKKLVEISKNNLRNCDFIVRFGGDEFIILLPNTNIQDARLVAMKIIEQINEYNTNKEFSFSISVGVSQYKSGDTSIDNLISRADDSLYEAKKIGKNCVV